MRSANQRRQAGRRYAATVSRGQHGDQYGLAIASKLRDYSKSQFDCGEIPEMPDLGP
jgi:hypothetical protein